MSTVQQPSISVVTTMYFSVDFISEFYVRIKKSLDLLGVNDYEIIFVNDGSPDDSLARARKLIELDRNVKVVNLSRNFGHHKAMIAGLAVASKEITYLIDLDLEEPPELLIELMETMWNTGADLVYGVQRQRKGKIAERIFGFVYYSLISLFAEVQVQRNLSTIRIMTNTYRKSLLLYSEAETPISVIWDHVGYKQVPLYFEKVIRKKGKSTYSFGKKLSLFIRMIASLGTRPLLVMSWLGGLMVMLSLIVAFLLLYQVIVNARVYEGWVSIILSVWFLGGINSAFLGIVGIYISNIVSEVKKRPLYIVKEIYSFHE